MYHIYKITNKENGKMYIGKTAHTTVEERWREHRNDARKQEIKNRPFYLAINKYGAENFKIELLETVETDEIACKREAYYIRHFNTYVGFKNSNGYNATLGGDGKCYISSDKNLCAKICEYYKKTTNIKDTAKTFKIDVDTVKKILSNNNIDIVYKKRMGKQPVAKIDPITFAVLDIYPSTREAERLNHTGKHVSEVCNGKLKLAGGFMWKYVSEIKEDELLKFSKMEESHSLV